jgi:RNA-directed DNA polymerase
VSKYIFSKLEKIIWQMLWRWAKRRHPKKNRRWVLKHYYQPHAGKQMVFFAETEDKRRIHLFQMSSIPIQRHIKIRQGVNPYEPKYAKYIASRHRKRWQDRELGIGTPRNLWIYQQGKCANCGTLITEETGWHAHHKLPKAEGGKDNMNNLILLHPNCHMQRHTLIK